MLNLLWIAFFLIGIAAALGRWLWLDDTEIFGHLVEALFGQAKAAFEIALGLTGVLAFWLGILRVAEQAGAVQTITRWLSPLFARLMPEVPSGHPALGAIVMNLSANVLGLDNAATPLGLKAMRELQSLNPEPHRASNAQVLFVVLNASSVTLLPVSIFTYRAQLGAAMPTDVFIPILLATFCSTLAGLVSVAWSQKLNLFDNVVLAYGGVIVSAIAALGLYFAGFEQSAMQRQSALVSNGLILALIAAFLLAALCRRIDAYGAFIEGAKEGFHTAVHIVPYLVAILSALAVLRASGALDLATGGVRAAALFMGWDGRFADALPTALVKPFSGSGARAMMVDTMRTFGADSFPGRLSTVIQGSTETTFYVLAVYFGAAGVRNVRHALPCALLADLAGAVAAILVSYWFFG